MDNPYYYGQCTQQDYYMRQMAQCQNLKGQYQNWRGWGMADSIDHSKDEPGPTYPEPEQTAWGQFKDLIKRIIP